MERRIRSQSGQSSTEYMLVISVVVIAVVSAAYAFVPTFQAGVQDLALDVQSILDGGTVGSVGLDRDNAASNGNSGNMGTGPGGGGSTTSSTN